MLNVKDPAFGAAGDGSTDDTTAVQSALNAAKVTGEAVYFPPGKYKITGTLTAVNCRLLGVGTFDPHDHTELGSVILADTTQKLLNIGSGTVIEGLVFYYANQPPNNATPVVTDYTIYFDGTLNDARMTRVVNNWFVNCYKIGYLGVGWGEFIQNKCCVLSTGITCEAIAAEQRIADNYFSFGIWFESIDQPIREWIAENASAIEINDAIPKISGNFFFGLNCAVQITGRWHQGSFINNGVDACRFGIWFTGNGTTWNSPISGNTFLIRRYNDDTQTVTSYAIYVQHTQDLPHPEPQGIRLQISANLMGGVNGDIIKIDNGAPGDAACDLICTGNDFLAPGRLLTTSFARYATRFDSPGGSLLAVGNAVRKETYQFAGGFRIFNAETVNVSNNIFEDLHHKAVQVDSADRAVVIGNVAIRSGSAYQYGTITKLEQAHNISDP